MIARRSAAATVRVVHQRCQGVGLCQAMAPEFFRLDPDGDGAAVHAEVVSDADLDLVQSVAECCPMGAVDVVTPDVLSTATPKE